MQASNVAKSPFGPLSMHAFASVDFEKAVVGVAQPERVHTRNYIFCCCDVPPPATVAVPPPRQVAQFVVPSAQIVSRHHCKPKTAQGSTLIGSQRLGSIRTVTHVLGLSWHCGTTVRAQPETKLHVPPATESMQQLVENPQSTQAPAM